MSRTLRIITTTGLTLYAKPSPIASGTWGDDAVALTANANDGREYTATVGDGDYVVFVQAGASPADTDVLRWTFDSTNINATRAGYIDKLNVTGTLANTDNADDFKATAPDNSGITAIKAKTDNLPANPAAVGSAMTLTSGERTSIAAAVWAVATSTLTTAGTIGKLVTDTLTNLASMIEDSTGWRFTTKSLEQGPSGSAAVTLTPIASTVDAGVVSEGVVTFYLDEGKTITITVVDNAGNNVDMTGKTLALTVEDDNQVEAFIVASGSITGANGSVSIVVAAADIDQVGTYCYYLREPSNANRLWAKGVLHIRYAA